MYIKKYRISNSTVSLSSHDVSTTANVSRSKLLIKMNNFFLYSDELLDRPALSGHTLFCDAHYKETITKILNKHSQKRNCAASVPISILYVSVSDLYIPTIGLPILLQENMWTHPGNI